MHENKNFFIKNKKNLIFIFFLLIIPLTLAITRNNGDISLNTAIFNFTISPENVTCTGSYFDVRMQYCEHIITINNKIVSVSINSNALSRSC